MKNKVIELIKANISEHLDWPQEGVNFKDLCPVFYDRELYAHLLREMQTMIEREIGNRDIDVVVGIEARGFILGAPLAYILGASFVPVRKFGKLPGDTCAYSYKLEYDSDIIEMQTDAIHSNSSIIVVDDVLATGGTLMAALELINHNFNCNILGAFFAVEIAELEASKAFGTFPVRSLMKL